MDDLDALATLLTKPEPSAEAAGRSRRRLQERMRGRRRSRWLAPGLGLAATAAAVAAVLVTGVAAPEGVPAASGREVLLMAAVSAERTPQGSGTYWHVSRTMEGRDPTVTESWTTRDGRCWSKDGPGSPLAVVAPAFSLKGAKVDLAYLEGLPTDPEELKASIAGLQGDERAMLPSEQRGDPLLPLIALISELPAPPKVRSTAFRLLAEMPGVRSEGTVEGGQRLLIPDEIRPIKLVVDPGTARVTRTNFLLGGNGSFSLSNGWIAVTTGWTDEPPR
ncbi:CU044_5270 family protein [Nonomuraea spiralis]|uniref:CU044_5270 family protein n=1 Tax=Nonomuraea TaxID=83681 RepID=UPI000F799C63|nr:CU044_5270 family protein [Nonomuraea sp. WAC 01424]RSM98690.1 hypothetical protein DMB42_43840 [Nonomuraea sp. WAC 01424]